MLDTKIAIIHEYNEVLIGRKSLVPAFFFGQTEREAEATALIIFRYAFDTYLGWSPEELRENLTYEIIEKLKLKQALKYIMYPPEFDKKKDMFYIVWKLYPHTANITLNEQVLRVYRMVLNGDLIKFPKEYFSGNEGRIKACICLNYMITEYMAFDTIEELYEIFASPAINSYFQQYRLNSLCKSLFLNPVDYLHTMLPSTQKIPFLFYYYSFELECLDIEKKEKKAKKQKEKESKKEGVECLES